MVGELWADGIASLVAHRPIDAVHRQELEGVGADESPHFLEIAGGGEQLVLIGRIDAVEIWMRDGRARNAHMHFAGPGLAHHLHDLHRGRAAYHAVVQEHDTLTPDLRLVGAVLQLDAKLTDALLGLDEGAADIVVTDDAELEGDTGFLRIADRCRHPGIVESG